MKLVRDEQSAGHRGDRPWQLSPLSNSSTRGNALTLDERSVRLCHANERAHRDKNQIAGPIGRLSSVLQLVRCRGNATIGQRLLDEDICPFDHYLNHNDHTITLYQKLSDAMFLLYYCLIFRVTLRIY